VKKNRWNLFRLPDNCTFIFYYFFREAFIFSKERIMIFPYILLSSVSKWFKHANVSTSNFLVSTEGQRHGCIDIIRFTDTYRRTWQQYTLHNQVHTQK
jgi:hypothetical protein